MKILSQQEVGLVDPVVLTDIISSGRCARAGSWKFYRSIKRATDGRFYAWIEDGKGNVMKLKGFKRRRDAKAWRNLMYHRRMGSLRSIAEAASKRRKPEPTPLELTKHKIEETRERIKHLDVKIKRLQTYKKKAQRRIALCESKIRRLEK